mmetsp:Transcript_22642/g.70884  ORF Transcript_22642/g.70884 Transcript_22642/m.70884 type:complete len:287 (-) Transcript_22642:1563-2423(-)
MGEWGRLGSVVSPLKEGRRARGIRADVARKRRRRRGSDCTGQQQLGLREEGEEIGLGRTRWATGEGTCEKEPTPGVAETGVRSPRHSRGARRREEGRLVRVVVELLGVVLGGLAVGGGEVEEVLEALEAEEAGGGGGGELGEFEARLGGADDLVEVEEDGGEEEVGEARGLGGDPGEGLLVLEGADPDLEGALLDGPDGLLEVGDFPGGGEGGADVLDVEPGRLGRDGELLDDVVAAVGLGVEEALDEGLGELAEVVGGVQGFPDAVDGGDGAEDEGEGGREAEDL